MATELPSLFSAGAEPRGRDPYSNYANPSDAGFGFGHDFGSASTSGGGGAGGGGIATLKSPFSPDRAHGAHGAYHDEVGTAGLRQRGGGGGIPPRPGGTPGDGLSSSALRSTQMSTGNAAPPTLSLLDSGAGGGGMLGGGAHTPTAHGTMTNGMMDLTTPPGTTPRRGAWGGGSVHGSGAPADYASTPRSALRHGGVGDGEVLAFNGTPRHPPHGGRVDDDERLVSTVGHAHGHAHAVNAHGRDERWKSWVLVFGFQAGGHAAATRRFQQFGEVMEHHLGKGNWLFVRYASALQAEKARAQNGELCSMCVGGETHQAIVGVSRVTHETAERLGLIGLLSALAADGGTSAGGAATADFDDAAHAASQLQWEHNDRSSKLSKFGRGELSRCNVAYDDLLLQPRPVFWYHNLFKWLVQTLTDFFLS